MSKSSSSPNTKQIMQKSQQTLNISEIKKALKHPKNSNIYWLGRWHKWQQVRHKSKAQST